MATIAKNGNVVVVNVFTMKDPNNLQTLADLMQHNIETVASKQQGFISSTLHKSLDGKRLVNYAQWRTQKDVDAAHEYPEFASVMAQERELADNYPFLYQVYYTHEESSS